jgi:hypothetical protein
MQRSSAACCAAEEEEARGYFRLMRKTCSTHRAHDTAARPTPASFLEMIFFTCAILRFYATPSLPDAAFLLSLLSRHDADTLCVSSRRRLRRRCLRF